MAKKKRPVVKASARKKRLARKKAGTAKAAPKAASRRKPTSTGRKARAITVKKDEQDVQGFAAGRIRFLARTPLSGPYDDRVGDVFTASGDPGR